MRYRNSDSFRTDAAHWGQTADLPAYVIEEIERLYERSDVIRLATKRAAS